MKKTYNINVVYYEDTGVYVGTSDDIPGLTIEEDSVHKFLETSMELVPYLLKRNLGVPKRKGDQVNVQISFSEQESMSKSKQEISTINWSTKVDSLHAFA